MPGKKHEIVRAELLLPNRSPSEADSMSHDPGAEFQPWFQSREVAHKIKRRQTVAEQRKWSCFFEDWGCLVCQTKTKPHCSNGMCQTCYSRVKQRLAASIRRRSATPRGDLSFMDTVRMAREAIAPALHVLPETTARSVRKR